MKKPFHNAGSARPLDTELSWRQLLDRDPAARFFYGVASTGVFCRPQCQSRRPLRRNVRFFHSAAEAQAAGFRPCLRCRPTAATALCDPLDKICTYIEKNLARAVPLAELGRVADLSPFTVQRLFRRKMGVSPHEYQRALRANSLRTTLKQGGRVTDAIYEAGFGSSSRAYENSPLGMPPARFARGGRGERIGYAAKKTDFGWIAAGATERGLCWLALAHSRAEAEATLHQEFPEAELSRNPSLEAMIDAAVASVQGKVEGKSETAALPLDLRGTSFQLKVWRALREIPRGQTQSYSQLARTLGQPTAVRAAARACAVNRVAILTPCHRVVGASGALTGYRWGVERKRQLLAAEGVAILEPPEAR